MKTYMMAASALLLSTSAFAYDAGKGMDPELAAKPEKAEAVAQSQQMKKAVLDVLSDASTEAKLAPASAVTWDSPETSIPLASDAPEAVDTSAGGLILEPDSPPAAEDLVSSSEASPDVAAYQGVGGPEEDVQIATADLSPRPAAGNYPACHPGQGDDNCIQLYEPGVREQLAGWAQPTGGFVGQPVQTAMGGPYEPADQNVDATAASDEVMAAADDTVAPTLAYAGDDINSGPLDDEGVPTA